MNLPIPLLVLALSLRAADGSPVAGSPASPLPHELERTQVVVALATDGTFVVDVVNDPYWLLWRLDDAVELADTMRITAAERDRRLVELQSSFAGAVQLLFDGRTVPLTVEYVPPEEEPVDPSLRVARMRLRGAVPEDATSFTWAHRLVEDPYPVLIYDRVGELHVRWVPGPAEAGPFEVAALTPLTTTETIRQYTALGFTHILPKGLDHILFVFGIFLLSTRLRPMVVQVTMFTLAHTITLALTVMGVVSLPSSIVEPLIAASIVYVAVENLVTSELSARRVALVFCFGLLHGMGFAGVLSELGLPRYELVAGLLSFNAGVELGQLAVIGLLFATVGQMRDRAWYRGRVVRPLSIAIALVGSYWTVTRVAGVM